MPRFLMSLRGALPIGHDAEPEDDIEAAKTDFPLTEVGQPHLSPAKSKRTVGEEKVIEHLSRFANVSAPAAFGLCPPARPNGLTTAESDALLVLHGRNVLKAKGPPLVLLVSFNALMNPFNVLLAGLAVISASTSDLKTMTVMLVMICASTVLRFRQEMRSTISASRLVEQYTTSYCKVLRSKGDGEVCEEVSISRANLVPGDVLCVVAGDVVAADGVVVKANGLMLNQSTLTGEVFPVLRTPSFDTTVDQGPGRFDILSASNVCLSGTSVVSGSGQILITGTGKDTYMASVSNLLSKRPANAFEIGIRKVSLLMIIFALVMTPIVFMIQGFISHDWKGALLFSVSVAVGLIPEMLPVVLTTNLAFGAVNMARKKVIVKRLDAVQNLGGCEVLLSDKTGSLTRDLVDLSHAVDRRNEPSPLALSLAYLNARFQMGARSLLDAAIVSVSQEALNRSGVPDVEKLESDAAKYVCKGEVPFDSTRRLLTVALGEVGDVDQKKTLLITKGAVEEVLSRCVSIEKDCNLSIEKDCNLSHVDSLLNEQAANPFDNDKRIAVMDLADRLNGSGYRLIAVATKVFTLFGPSSLTFSDEADLTFIGLLAFLDPPKPDAAETVRRFRELKVDIKICTGDASAVAVKVAKDIGILPLEMTKAVRGAGGSADCTESTISIDPRLDRDVLTGADLAELSNVSDAKTLLPHAVRRAVIFAKVSPHQKLQIVEILRQEGLTTAFLGDGVNDALALRAADVGVAVDSGTEIAKDAADIILLEKSLGAIADGVFYGRLTMVNTLKYIKMAASSNFGNVFSILAASAWLPYTPMEPIQILVQNLLYDFSQASIPWDLADPEMLEHPRKWEIKSLFRFMIILGPTSSVFDIATFSINWFYFNIRTLDSPLVSKAQTHWFIEGFLTQLLVVYSLRTPKIPFVQSRPSWIVLAVTIMFGIIGIAIPFIGPISRAFNMVRPAPIFYVFLITILCCYLLLVHLVKRIYLRIFHGEWI